MPDIKEEREMRNKSKLIQNASVISAALLLSPVSYALEDEVSLDNNNNNNNKNPGIERIIVTTQKRIQSIQEVPIAISSVDTQMAANIGADKITDIIPMIPGITGNTVGLATNFWSIRGISSNDFSLGSEPSVGVFIDDAYIGRNGLATGAFFDIERIEVVKGPQGTLFGRNSAAGAVSIITAKPEDDTLFEFGAALGNEGQRDFNMMANVEATDELALRFSYYGSEAEGFRKEVTFNEEGYIEQDSFRLAAQWLVSDDFTALLTFNYSESESNMSGSINPSLQTIEPGEEFPEKYAKSTQDLEANQTQGATLRLTWDVNEDLTFTSISDARGFDLTYKQDVDGTADDAYIDAAFAVGTGGATLEYDQPEIEQSSVSQEFRLNGHSESFDWFVGLNYFKEEVNEITNLNLIDTALGLGLLAVDQNITEGETTSTGIYGDITWYVNDALSIIGGIRWSEDKKEWCATGTAEIGLIAVPTLGAVCGEDKWSEMTPRLVANFQINPDIMVYGSFSKGYKGGGFNSVTADYVDDDGIGDTVASFAPETINAFELGVKSDWLEGYLRLNASAYVNDYQNLQVQTATLAGIFITNAAEAKTQGVEFELTYETPIGVVLMANYSLLDTEFEEGVNTGNSLAFAPENSYSIAADYEMELDEGRLNLFAMYAWQDDFFYDADNTLAEESRGLLSAKLTYRPNSDGWDLGLGVQNAMNKEYSNLRQDIGLGQAHNYGMPRMYKFEFNMYF